MVEREGRGPVLSEASALENQQGSGSAERRLLAALADQPGQPVKRSALIDQADVSRSSFPSFLSRLRRELRSVGLEIRNLTSRSEAVKGKESEYLLVPQGQMNLDVSDKSGNGRPPRIREVLSEVRPGAGELKAGQEFFTLREIAQTVGADMTSERGQDRFYRRVWKLRRRSKGFPAQRVGSQLLWARETAQCLVSALWDPREDENLWTMTKMARVCGFNPDLDKASLRQFRCQVGRLLDREGVCPVARWGRTLFFKREDALRLVAKLRGTRKPEEFLHTGESKKALSDLKEKLESWRKRNRRDSLWAGFSFRLTEELQEQGLRRLEADLTAAILSSLAVSDLERFTRDPVIFLNSFYSPASVDLNLMIRDTSLEGLRESAEEFVLASFIKTLRRLWGAGNNYDSSKVEARIVQDCARLQKNGTSINAAIEKICGHFSA